MWPSPALHETHPAKHQDVSARDGSSGREDRDVLDGGGGEKGTKGHKQIIQDEQPNTGRVHQMEPDGPLYCFVGATNQPLYVIALLLTIYWS